MIFHVPCLNISPKTLPPCGKKCISGFGRRASVTTGTCHNYPRSPLLATTILVSWIFVMLWTVPVLPDRWSNRGIVHVCARPSADLLSNLVMGNFKNFKYHNKVE